MKKIIFSLLLIVIFQFSELYAQSETKQITLNDIFRSRKFYPEYISGIRSLNNGEHYCIFGKGQFECL